MLIKESKCARQMKKSCGADRWCDVLAEISEIAVHQILKLCSTGLEANVSAWFHMTQCAETYTGGGARP